MTDKELRRLSRKALLEMLIEQGKELARVNKLLDEANRQLEDRTLQVSNAGSIAEASLAVNQVFEAAQKAADQYLENIAALQESSRVIRQNAEALAEKILSEAAKERGLLLQKTKEECLQMIQHAKEAADEA